MAEKDVTQSVKVQARKRQLRNANIQSMAREILANGACSAIVTDLEPKYVVERALKIAEVFEDQLEELIDNGDVDADDLC